MSHDTLLVEGRDGILVPQLRLVGNRDKDNRAVAEAMNRWIQDILRANRDIVNPDNRRENYDNLHQQLVLPPSENLPLIILKYARMKQTHKYKTTGTFAEDPDPGYMAPETITTIQENHLVQTMPDSSPAAAFTNLYESSAVHTNGQLSAFTAGVPSDEAWTSGAGYGTYLDRKQSSERPIMPGIQRILEAVGYGTAEQFNANNYSMQEHHLLNIEHGYQTSSGR